MQLKTPSTYEQQIEQLRKKNVIIEDEELAKRFLHFVSYYRLSGYFLPYTRLGEKKLFIPIRIEQLKAIYEFDSKLRNIIVHAIEAIEIYLKSQLSYHHAFKYGADGYMNPKNYNNKHNHDRFISRINSCIAENKSTLVVQHHINNYDGKFPIWVIIEYFSMGMLSYFYKDMRSNDKVLLAKELYNVNYTVLESWLRCITDLRNKCAHYSRLYYWIFPALPKMPLDVKYIPTRRLFAQLLMLKFMYPDHERWNENVATPLIKLVKQYSEYISMKHLDFPYRWKSMILWKNE